MLRLGSSSPQARYSAEEVAGSASVAPVTRRTGRWDPDRRHPGDPCVTLKPGAEVVMRCGYERVSVVPGGQFTPFRKSPSE